MKEDLIDINTYYLPNCISIEYMIKMLKTKYKSNFERFSERFLKIQKKWLLMNDIENVDDIINHFIDIWNNTKEYSYKEIFEIKNVNFRSLMFSNISISEMIKDLGSERIMVEGKDLINNTWNTLLNKFEEKELTQVYELHAINGTKLGLNEPVYYIKCWCTSTDNEHWLALDKKVNPLEGIASLCKYYKSMKGKIKHIIRQGDVFLFEMNEIVIPNENEEIINMEVNEYFSLLKSQS